MAGDVEHLVRRYVEAFNERDWNALAPLLHEDLIHDDSAGARRIGRDAFRQYLAERAEHGSETLADVAVLAASDGNRAAAEFTLRSRTAAGESAAVAAGEFYEIDGGRLARISRFARSASATTGN